MTEQKAKKQTTTLDLFKDVIGSLNSKEKHIFDESTNFALDIKAYNAYMVNRNFSQGLDTLIFANEMNRYYNLPPKMQYDFYYYGIPAAKRWNKWAKKENINNIDAVKEYFDYSDRKAREVLKILTDEQIEEIRNRIYKGEIVNR